MLDDEDFNSEEVQKSVEKMFASFFAMGCLIYGVLFLAIIVLMVIATWLVSTFIL